jgi:hypothetical protein
MSTRDRRALAMLAVALVLGLAYRFWPGSSGPAIVAPVDPVGLAEKRLAKLRETAATAPAKEEIFKKVSADLASREKGLIVADTGAQAQAHLVEMIRTLGRAETPPVEIRSYELGPVRPLGDAYGEAPVAVQIDCRIDQLINLIAALGAQPELITSTDLRVSSTNAREKTVSVRLAFAGVVPRRLVPERKGSF